MSDNDEFARRKSVIAAGRTDVARWTDSRQLAPAWDSRARVAAGYIPAGATVLDLGCGAMALERFLPRGCRYLPCDLTARDERTIVRDFNAGEFPTGVACDTAVVLGVVEYLYDVPAFLAALRGLGRPVVLSYCYAGGAGPADRRANGWVNDFTQVELVGLLKTAGFERIVGHEVTPGQLILKLTPVMPRTAPERDVWVVSLANTGNFGDRLGVQLLNSVMPPNARVTHISHNDLAARPEGRPDLLVLGMGNSLFEPLLVDGLFDLVAGADQTVGIFGTQYHQVLDPVRLGALIDRLDVWWARYEEDVLLYGDGRANTRHLGDWLVDAFPLNRWRLEETLTVGPEIMDGGPVDRLIEYYQAFRRVRSPRLHSLLCAVTSAEEVAYEEQTELGPDHGPSGKFRAMMIDVFGVERPPQQFWSVDRLAVRAYKAKVRGNVEAMRADLARILA